MVLWAIYQKIKVFYLKKKIILSLWQRIFLPARETIIHSLKKAIWKSICRKVAIPLRKRTFQNMDQQGLERRREGKRFQSVAVLAPPRPSPLHSHAGPVNWFFKSLSAEFPGGYPSILPSFSVLIPSYGFDFFLLGRPALKALHTALGTHEVVCILWR